MAKSGGARIQFTGDEVVEHPAAVRFAAPDIDDVLAFSVTGPENLAAGSELAELVHRAGRLVEKGGLREAYAVLEPELTRDGGLGPTGARVALLLEGSRILVRLGRYGEAAAHARRALALAEVHGDARLAAESLGRLGLSQLRAGDLDGARVSYGEALLRFRRHGDDVRVAAMENNLGLVSAGLGQWPIARSHFQSSIALARRHGPRGTLGYRLKNLGLLETKSGRWARAREFLDEAAALLHDDATGRHSAPIALARGQLALAAGRLDEAQGLLAHGLARALAHGQPREEAVAREFLGDVAFEREAFREAWQHYRAALAVAEPLLPALDLECEILHRLARAHLRLDDLPAAEAALARARAAAHAMQDPYERARIDVVAAELAVARERPNEARTFYAEAVDRWGELGELQQRGRALVAWAALMDERSTVRRLLTRAAACFEEAGAAGELRAVEQRLFRELPAEGRPPAPAPSGGGQRIAIAGNSRAMVAARAAVYRASRCALPVLIEGPRGAGRTFLARAIHGRSARAEAPLVRVSCGTLAPDRVLLDLVGDARGARPREGWIAQAEGGTLLLEDVGELTPAAQSLVRQLVLARTYVRPGELAAQAANVRVVAITDPGADGTTLRDDLRQALSGIAIALPPLRARRADIAPLARAFLRVYGGADAPALAPAAERALVSHAWPGHVRELELVARGALVHTPAGAKVVDAFAVRAAIRARLTEFPAARRARAGLTTDASIATVLAGVPDPLEGEAARLRARMADVERCELVQAIERAKGNKSRAARLLGISRKTLYARLSRHGLLEPGSDDAP